MPEPTYKPLKRGRYRCSLCKGRKGIIKRARINADRSSHKPPKPPAPKTAASTPQKPRVHQSDLARRKSPAPAAMPQEVLKRVRISFLNEARCPFCDRNTFVFTEGIVKCRSPLCDREFIVYK